MHTRIRYIHEQLHARAWYVAQVFPPPTVYVRQLTSMTSVFLWQGELFRVQLTTIKRPKHEGGWELLSFLAKCRTLLLLRLQRQLTNESSLSTTWMKIWQPTQHSKNPPAGTSIPRKFEYLDTYNMESAYITAQRDHESLIQYKKRIYHTVLYYVQAPHGLPIMRVQRMRPTVSWSRTWRNPHDTPGTQL
jgi:hypothetical protein